MDNVKGDIAWGAIFLLCISILVIPDVRIVFINMTEVHPYLGGFLKFFVLASMGDLLGGRVLNGKWSIPQGFLFKAVIWGILGMMITLVFTVFITGTAGAQANGRLPFEGSKLALAIFGSIIMNTTFGPMMYIYHKFGDIFVDQCYEKKNGIVENKITFETMVNRVDWYGMVSFSWARTCTFIWIPCHTLVFLLPAEYRVIASAFLSIVLGIIVALSKKKDKK